MQTKKSFIIAFLTLSFIFSAFSYPVQLDIYQHNVIVVTGNVQVRNQPDIAEIYVYISETGKTGEEATSKAEEKVDAIIEAVKPLGVTKDDIATGYYYVYPIYDYSSGTPKLNGYSVSQSLTITIRGIKKNNNKVSQVIDAITATGVNSISGITYRLANQEQGKSQARVKAFNEAKLKAQQYSKLANRRLGKIYKIDQSTPAYNLPYSINTSVAPQPKDTSFADIITRLANVIVFQLI